MQLMAMKEVLVLSQGSRSLVRGLRGVVGVNCPRRRFSKQPAGPSLFDSGKEAIKVLGAHFNGLKRDGHQKRVPWVNEHPFFESPLDHEYIKFWQALHEPNQTGTFEGLLQKFDACKAWEVESMFARALLRLGMYVHFDPNRMTPAQEMQKRAIEHERRMVYHSLLLRLLSLRHPKLKQAAVVGDLASVHYLPFRSELIEVFGLDGTIPSTALMRPADHIQGMAADEHFSSPVTPVGLVDRIAKPGRDPLLNNADKPASVVWGVHSLSFLSLGEACKLLGCLDDGLPAPPTAAEPMPLLLTPDDLINSNVADNLPTLPVHPFQDYCYHKEMFEVPTQELVVALSEYLAERCAELGTMEIVELGAGHGRLAVFLNRAPALKNNKLKVIPCDPFPLAEQRRFVPEEEEAQAGGGGAPTGGDSGSSIGGVLRKDAARALALRRPPLVLASWLPMGLDLRTLVSNASHVQEVLVLGSMSHGGQQGLQGTPGFMPGKEVHSISRVQLCRYDHHVDKATGRGVSTAMSFRRNLDMAEAELV